MGRLLIIGCILLLSASALQGQIKKSGSVVCNAIVENGDTIPVVVMDEAVVSQNRSWNKKFQGRYSRLEPKVIKTYPYAKAAGELMAYFESQFILLTDEKDQKVFLDLAEEELKRQFEGEIRRLTISEGYILIQLIDRETGDTSYELIQELKGKFSAFMWQSLARLFGHNLKDEYEANGDDIIIERVVRRIESGELKVLHREVVYPEPFAVK